MPQQTLRDWVVDISTREPSPNRDYYALTLFGDEDGNLLHSCYSHWEGFADKERRIELRAASIVVAERVARLWREIGEGCAVINDLSEMDIYLQIGGHAVVEKSVAEAVVGEWLGAKPVRMSGPLGFVHVEALPQSALNRAPAPKLRMQVLQRDDYRCRICGRRSADHVDVELHVHHIRPWGSGGLTEDSNLITLCHTCHKGLDPHFNPRLFGLIESCDFETSTNLEINKYWNGVQLYRENLSRMQLVI